jgi:hypothetical protein
MGLAGARVRKINRRPFTDSSRYVSFVKERNRALEGIFQMYLARTDKVVSDLHRGCDEVVSLALQRPSGPLRPKLEPKFALASHTTWTIALRLRQTAYTLAVASQAEAMGRALGRPQKAVVTKAHLQDVFATPAPGGGPLRERLQMYFHRLEHRVEDAVRQGTLQEEKFPEISDRIARAFPKKKVVRLTKGPIGQAMREAAEDARPHTIITDLIDDDAWDDVVEDYLDAFVPSSRQRGGAFQVKSEWVGTGEARREKYAWEVEQEITQDFVERVREGQHDAAKVNGYTDMVWIDVVDDREDDCCNKRGGKTTSEIKAMLASGELDADECDAVVTPAHFKCRCDEAPVTNSLPDVEPFELGGFEAWLMN